MTVRSMADLPALFLSLPPHNGDAAIADANLALMRAATRHAKSIAPRVPYELTAKDRIFLTSIRVGLA